MEDWRKEDIPDPENLFYSGNNANSYSGNLDRLFADDEIQSAPIIVEKASPPRTKSMTFFSSAAFWKNGSESVKVGIILSYLDDTNDLSFLMCDASKKVLKKLRVDDVEFFFMGESLAVRLEEPSEENCVDVKFVDRLTFLNFSITTILRSSNHNHFKVFDGSGSTQIDSTCDIRYNLTKHSCDDEGQLKLPDERKGVKARLSKEKLKDHVVYQWLEGCRKGAHVLIKDSESSVFEVVVDKVRKASDEAPESKETSEEPVLLEETEVDQLQSDGTTAVPKSEEKISNTSSDDLLTSADETLIPTPSPAPRLMPVNQAPWPCRNSEPQQKQESPVSDDIRDVLHRIVGIELDRIEIRLNARFEQLQNNINARLDRQTEILQKLFEKSSFD